jgi:hypothetical protein
MSGYKTDAVLGESFHDVNFRVIDDSQIETLITSARALEAPGL